MNCIWRYVSSSYRCSCWKTCFHGVSAVCELKIQPIKWGGSGDCQATNQVWPSDISNCSPSLKPCLTWICGRRRLQWKRERKCHTCWIKPLLSCIALHVLGLWASRVAKSVIFWGGGVEGAKWWRLQPELLSAKPRIHRKYVTREGAFHWMMKRREGRTLPFLAVTTEKEEGQKWPTVYLGDD